ncbi:glycosyltransferase [Sphingobacterium sp. MYb382]|uniref:glycosyltransferase n=1 Tax=Sphingobacterium sp. MYb382 TaxID=2745278 RepID=UPI00309D81C9
MDNSIKLSFCITCKNRINQIKRTLPKNLADNYSMKHKIDFVLIDFDSTDGLQDWLINNFEKEINEGYLKYYWTDQLPEWHLSIAKNTAHILAKGDILVNLDCDNYTGKNGGKFVLEHMLKYGIESIIFHQFSNTFGDGSCGRIAVSRKNFLSIGGYNEDFHPMGYQDIDIIIRLMIKGLNYIHVGTKKYNRAIPNIKEKGLENSSSKLTWGEMNTSNFILSRHNITTGNLIANANKPHIGIIKGIFSFKEN